MVVVDADLLAEYRRRDRRRTDRSVTSPGNHAPKACCATRATARITSLVSRSG